MERLFFDTVAAVILLATALIGAFLPKHLEAHGKGDATSALMFHLGNMLSGGVMLSAGFCHLLADALRRLAFLGHFPIATFLAATGYILTLCADQVVQMVMDRAANGGGSGGCGSDGAGGPEYRALTHMSPPVMSPAGPGTPVAARSGPAHLNGGGHHEVQMGQQHQHHLHEQQHHHHQQQHLQHQQQHLQNQQQQQQQQQQQRHEAGQLQQLRFAVDSDDDDGEMQEVALGGGGGGGGGVLQPISCSPQRQHAGARKAQQRSPAAAGLTPRGVAARGLSPGGRKLRAQLNGQHLEHQHSLHDNPFEHVLDLEMSVAPHNHFQVFLANRRLSFATALLLAGALCIHSVLEGMALGAQATVRDSEDIFLAIVAHKGLAAYALGTSIIESRASDVKFWTTIGLFASATPAGIFMGYAFAEHGGGGVGAGLSALAAGTFIYVALMEVVPKELEDGRHRGLKMLAMLTGFGLMSLLAVWA